MKKYGGVKLIARPVDFIPPEPPSGLAYYQPSVRVPPFAGGRPSPKRTTPNFLDYAAFYLAAVLCDLNGHGHDVYDRSEKFPCDQSFQFASEQVHRLAEHRFTVISPVKEEAWQGKKGQEAKRSGRSSVKRSTKKRR